MPEIPEVLTIPEAAAALKLSKQSARKLLTPVLVGGSYRYLASDVAALLTERSA